VRARQSRHNQYFWQIHVVGDEVVDANAAQMPSPRLRARTIKERADWVFVVAASLSITYLLLILLTFEYGRDQGIYAVVADAISKGGAPYGDAWDFKPPFIFFIYAVARGLFGPSMTSIRIVEAAGLVSLVAAFAILSKRFLGNWRAGLVGGALAIFIHVELEFWHTAQPESFGAIVVAWALVCATYVPRVMDPASRWKQYGAWLAAGALYTIAALLKPPLGGGFLVSLAFVLAQQWHILPRERRWRGALSVCVAFGLGAVVVLGGTLSFFAARDSLAEAYETFFVFTPQYTGLGFEPAKLPSFLWRAVEQSLTGFSILLPLGLTLLAALGSRAKREVNGTLHVLGVVALQLLGVALQAKFFEYHYGAALPLLALLAGWGLWKLWSRLFTNPLRVAATVVLVAVVLGLAPKQWSSAGASPMAKLVARTKILLGEGTPATIDRLHSKGDVSFGADRAMAEWLRTHTSDRASVFIWGFEPMVYDLAGRRAASRYIYNIPQRLDWPGSEAARQELMKELEQDEPEVILVVKNDIFTHVTGNLEDSRAALQRFDELKQFIDVGYRFEGSIEDFMIYKRRDGNNREVRLDSCPGCNVLLISIDTLRADHVSCYGYARNTTPEICAFFSNGLRFERAFSQSPWTAPAHASMFTGLLPARHGVTYGPLIPVLKGHPTIFEVLQDKGYFTAALYGGGYVNPVMPSAHVDFKRIVELRGGLVDHFRSALQNKGRQQPFFLFMHGYDVHTPYSPKANYFLDAKPEIDARARDNRYCKYVDADDRSRFLDPRSVPSDPETQQYLESLYDSEIKEVDQSLGRFFHYLETSGLLERTIVILTADHGEEFWDHGSCEHVKTVHNELLHVPLFVRMPGGPSGVDDTPVAASIDILPTVADALGWPPFESVDGRSLLHPATSRDIVSEAQFHYDSQHLRRYSIVRGPHKLIHDANRDTRDLYDLQSDWGEQHALTGSQDTAKALFRALSEYVHEGAPVVQHEGALDPQTLEQLRQLGYIE
jgi:arylsulfatase A-like enzyme